MTTDDTRPFEGAAGQAPAAADETLIVYGPHLPQDQAAGEFTPAVPLFMAPGYLREPWPAWDSLGGITFQRCGGCQAVYADGDAGTEDCYLGRMWASAVAAGWRESPLRGLLCPDCREERDDPGAGHPEWADGPGTKAYEDRIAAHVATLAEIDRSIPGRQAAIHEPALAKLTEIRLRIADAMEAAGRVAA